MATKSISKNIDIRDKNLAKKFVLALENAENKTSKTVHIDKTVRTATREDIAKIFKEPSE